MSKLLKLIGVVVLTAIIVFSMAACITNGGIVSDSSSSSSGSGTNGGIRSGTDSGTGGAGFGIDGGHVCEDGSNESC